MKLNAKNYEYLWTDHDVNYIFTSCYLFPAFRKADIVLIYDWRKKGLQFFLSKEQRKMFSAYGVLFYNRIFPGWREKTITNIKNAERIIKETEEDKKIISSMTNEKLQKNFLERAKLFQEIGDNYFYTEFFFLDEVEMLMKSSPDKHKQMISNCKEMGKIKLQARKILNKFYNHEMIFRPYINEVSKRTKRKYLQWLSYEEIIQVLNNNVVPLSNRDKTTWVLTKHNGWDIITGKTSEKIALNFQQQTVNKRMDVVKGNIANKGIHRGRAKIVRTFFSNRIKEEIKKVEEGDVLLAETTGPEMMVACQKAGAIVTDEGGITSHAAIVSRELNKPCIIGTKIATKVFNDGDLIEVDADKGIVKKIDSL